MGFSFTTDGATLDNCAAQTFIDYLPHEFSYAIILCVYIPPSADEAQDADIINSAIGKLPDAFKAVFGDFKQFVDCKTRVDKTLDLLHANVKEPVLY